MIQERRATHNDVNDGEKGNELEVLGSWISDLVRCDINSRDQMPRLKTRRRGDGNFPGFREFRELGKINSGMRMDYGNHGR